MKLCFTTKGTKSTKVEDEFNHKGHNVERPMKFEFVIHLNAAKQIGFTVPPNVLVRANRVIR